MADPRRTQPNISFRALQRPDYPLLQQWLAAPHVALWWNENFDLHTLEAKYGPRIDGHDPVHVYLILHEHTPIGWTQWYRWSDFPRHAAHLMADAHSAGLDLAIGEHGMTGLGLGPTILCEFARQHIFVNPDITAIVSDPAEANESSVRAFEKAGFFVVRTVRLPEESFVRMVVRCNRP